MRRSTVGNNRAERRAVCRRVPREAAAETMESALAKAYENNPQLNAQRAIVRQTDEGVPMALSGYRPTISANASVGREYTDTKQDDSANATGLPNGVSFEAKGLIDARIRSD